MAWGRKDFPACIEALQNANRLAPSNTGILVQLGRIHGLRYDYAAAESCFEQALRLTPHKTELLTSIGIHCRNFRNQDLVERYLRRALEETDATPLACIKLAELYERLRRLPEATQLVERALQLEPAIRRRCSFERGSTVWRDAWNRRNRCCAHSLANPSPTHGYTRRPGMNWPPFWTVRKNSTLP